MLNLNVQLDALVDLQVLRGRNQWLMKTIITVSLKGKLLWMEVLDQTTDMYAHKTSIPGN